MEELNKLLAEKKILRKKLKDKIKTLTTRLNRVKIDINQIRRNQSLLRISKDECHRRVNGWMERIKSADWNIKPKEGEYSFVKYQIFKINDDKIFKRDDEIKPIKEYVINSLNYDADPTDEETEAFLALDMIWEKKNIED